MSRTSEGFHSSVNILDEKELQWECRILFKIASGVLTSRRLINDLETLHTSEEQKTTGVETKVNTSNRTKKAFVEAAICFALLPPCFDSLLSGVRLVN